MKAVILAAGKSTRTYPLTVNKPKPLLKIANKTILEHNLEQLVGIVKETIIIVGFKAEQIIDYFGDRFRGINILYVQQKKPLGTGHALLQAAHLINNRFILMMGDDMYSKKDISWCLKNKNQCVLVSKVKNPERFGVVKHKNNYLKDIIEKPKKPISNLANTGFYVLNKKIFEYLKRIKKSRRKEYEIVDAIKEMAKKEKIFCQKLKDYWLSMTYPWDVLKANEFMLDRIKKRRIKGLVEKNVTIKGNVTIDKGTLVKNGSYIEGPVVIGKNCVVGPNCFIRANSTIGDGCKVGNAVEIKNSVLFGNSYVSHLSYVGDSIIGDNVNYGAGTIVANLRHNNENIKTMVNGKLVDTGRRKFGTVVGDNVKTGVGTLIYPGRKIWPDKTTLPKEAVKRDIV